MTLKSHAKFEEKLNCGLENDMRIFGNFHQNTLMCQNWYFHGIVLSKAENAWATTYRGVSKILKNLKNFLLEVSKIYTLMGCMTLKNDEKSEEKNWLVVSKLTQKLESLKNIHFNGLLLTKVYNVWAKKM